MSCMCEVAMGRMGVMSGFFVIASLVMFCGFSVVIGCALVMLSCTMMMLRCFLRHLATSSG